MSNFSVSDDVRELISDIIDKNGWEVYNVKYYPATEAGDGYASKHVAVDIIKKGKTLRLFVKYAIGVDLPDVPLEKLYANESYFYDVVYPAYLQFLKERNIEDGFRNVPKCYGTSVKNVVALENLKERGYTLFDRRKIMNEEHITFVLKTFARFHAVSFAFKDQDREKYDKLVDGTNTEIVNYLGDDSPFAKMSRKMITDALSKLDAVADKHILEKCDPHELARVVISVDKHLNEYSILTQGDCWCNNMMFLYKEEDKENPIDVVLVDWQLVRPASPVFDIAYFFYTVACEEALNKLDFYLNVYYTELSDQIKMLGSDPAQLYPFEILQKEWKQHCKYGFVMAFTLLKFMLIATEEIITNLEEVKDMKDVENMDMFTTFGREDEYIRRSKLLAEFMINNNYL